ncbi:DUF2730 family protein [Rhizobium sp. C1]|uniref:DUF2730 family protein n=1 Tax=Rhizobium sp. C1 TaxID=1349799 RepID=UPI001E582D16|nr:DUF2730 family protein [Rhizobium sp. C1]MCD2176458.1 DUF2730 domain-containing protein [Rhizobium sp. C1]
MIDLSLMKDWLGVISTCIAVLTAIYAWLTKRAADNSRELKDLTTKVTELATATDKRLGKIEADMKHMPDAEALVELKLALADMKGSFGRFEEKMAAVSRTVVRVEEFLLKNGGERGDR